MLHTVDKEGLVPSSSVACMFLQPWSNAFSYLGCGVCTSAWAPEEREGLASALPLLERAGQLGCSYGMNITAQVSGVAAPTC